jgi:GWxTD domain-containing protein
MRKGIIHSIFLLLLGSISILAGQNDQPGIFTDAVWFRNGSDTTARVDIYTLVPYQALQFTAATSGFMAQYDISIACRDAAGRRSGAIRTERIVQEEDYEKSRGVNAEFDYTQLRVDLPAGQHDISVLVRDPAARREYQQNLKIIIPPLGLPKEMASAYQLSGLMLCSSVEEKPDGGTIITPHASSNIARLSEGFFIFFELYHRGQPQPDSIVLFYEICNENGSKVLAASEPATYSAGIAEAQQIYMPIKPLTTFNAGNYLIRLKVRRAAASTDAPLLCSSERIISIERTIGGIVMKDLEKSVRQMRYIATQAEIDFILEGATPDEKKSRFEEYWKKQDPTPMTQRNEAFEDYYGRIDFANKNFRTYTDGWMTDMGMLYIILGPPLQSERTPRRADGRTFARWTYANNRQFTFVDNSGFDDFRLTTPFPAGEKYQYRGSW